MENSGGRSNHQRRYIRHGMNRCRCTYRARGGTGCLMVLLGLAVIGGSIEYWYVVVPALAVIVLFAVAHHNVDRMNAWAELLVAEGQVVIEERARSAALAERTHIAREIHDVLPHSLSGLMLQLEAAHLLLG